MYGTPPCLNILTSKEKIIGDNLFYKQKVNELKRVGYVKYNSF